MISDDRLREIASSWGLPDLDPAALRHALTHSSAVAVRSSDSNERLEFLGDAIVNTVVAEYLFDHYPDRNEGDLAKGRALVVSKVAFYEVGVRLGLESMIVVGSNAEGLFARSSRAMTADALEAVFAVAYLQFGWEKSREFILRILEPELASVHIRVDLRDAKTILQERAQAEHRAGPVYRTVSESGDPHNRIFTAQVTLHNGIKATGSGKSKKDAQQAAASAALQIEDELGDTFSPD